MQNHETPLFAMIQAMTSIMPPSSLGAGDGPRWQQNSAHRPAPETKRGAWR